jgi:trans-aconitate 2-methyltransferase
VVELAQFADRHRAVFVERPKHHHQRFGDRDARTFHTHPIGGAAVDDAVQMRHRVFDAIKSLLALDGRLSPRRDSGRGSGRQLVRGALLLMCHANLMLSPYRPVVGKTGDMPEMPATHLRKVDTLERRRRPRPRAREKRDGGTRTAAFHQLRRRVLLSLIMGRDPICPRDDGSGGAVMSQWDPGQYERFAAERAAPFFDLLGLIEPSDAPRMVDLGCGTGELTAQAHRQLGARETIGIDNSSTMLARANDLHVDGVAFEHGDVTTFTGDGSFDVVLSNAALQWLPDHRAVLGRWARALRDQGQLAVQLPSNADHCSHVVAAELANESPFVDAFDGEPPPDPLPLVLAPETYAEILEDLGFSRQHVRLQVYPPPSRLERRCRRVGERHEPDALQGAPVTRTV